MCSGKELSRAHSEPMSASHSEAVWSTTRDAGACSARRPAWLRAGASEHWIENDVEGSGLGLT
jgi:hypothetical protein